VFALGVKREYRHTGTAAAFYAEHWRECLRQKIRRVETGWILETNEPMSHALEALGGDVVKRYRLYERPFERSSDEEGGRPNEEHADLEQAVAGERLRRAPGPGLVKVARITRRTVTPSRGSVPSPTKSSCETDPSVRRS